MLECYFKHNKDVYKKFCKKVEEDEDSDVEQQVPKKRKRADSNMSLRSDKSKTIKKGRK